MEKVPWHLQTGPVTKGRFNPSLRDDVVSRSTWVENVLEGDKKRDLAFRRMRLKKLYPGLTLTGIEYYLQMGMDR
jgi:hypothetical protein